MIVKMNLLNDNMIIKIDRFINFNQFSPHVRSENLIYIISKFKSIFNC